jgi:hypothetical protein
MPQDVYTDTHQPTRRTWPQAFMAFMRDHRASLFLKWAFGLGPITILDDLVPGIGLIDNPLIPVWLIVVVVVFFRVRSYRNIP